MMHACFARSCPQILIVVVFLHKRYRAIREMLEWLEYRRAFDFASWKTELFYIYRYCLNHPGGGLDLLRWVLERPWMSSLDSSNQASCLNEAARLGLLDSLSIMHEHGFQGSGLYAAVLNEDQEMIVRLFADGNRVRTKDYRFMNKAYIYQVVEVVKRCDPRFANRVFKNAVMNDDVRILEWLHKHECMPDVEEMHRLLNKQTRMLDHSIVLWLFDHAYVLHDERYRCTAIDTDHLERLNAHGFGIRENIVAVDDDDDDDDESH
jgi:hypothetical protein